MKTYTLLFVAALWFLLSSAHAQDSGCLTVKKISSSNHAVQQGGDIVLTAKLVTSHCRIPAGAVGAEKQPVLSVEAPEGFQAGQPTIEIGKIENIPVNSYIWMAHEMTVHFTLHAFHGTPSGVQVVPGTLTYTSVDEKGDTSSHTVALNFPIQVVPPPKPGFWDQHPQAREAWVTTGEVLLVIIAMPWFIVGNILGFYHWDC
jgi:hypothetical protein